MTSTPNSLSDALDRRAGLFLGFVFVLCAIGLVLRMGVRGFKHLTGINCGLADAVSVHAIGVVRAGRKGRDSEEEES